MRTALAGSMFFLFAVPQIPRAQVPGVPANVPVSLADRQKALNDLFHDFWEEFLKLNPEFASRIGDKRYNDKISDYSVSAVNDWLARERDYQMRLAAIDPTGFTTQEKISQDLLMRDLEDDEDAAQFKEWEMPVNQMDGIYATYPQLVTQLSFTTVKDYDDWIARLHAIPKAFQQVTTNMSIGMDDHRVPPKYLLEKTLAQVNQLANQNPEDSPLALPLKKFPSSIPAADQARIKTEMLNAISKEVLPAYKRFARFLQVSYIPAGRGQPGISALPDGAAYYRFLVRRTTTTDLTPDQIHQIGVEQVQKDEAEMLAIAKKLGFSDLKSFRASIKTNPKLHPTSRQALLDAYSGYLKAMQAKLPELFGTLPKAPFEIEPVPDYLEKTAPPAYYEPGTPDGSRPGKLMINLYNATDRNLYSVEAIAYHEGLPGHHLQISIAQELKGIPEFRKYEGYTAYTEGWGLYAEQLGKDAGFYQDPYSDYGRLEADIWRAIRLVVDTGVHSEGWTRDQMVQYFRDHSNIDETSIQTEVDRYIAWPSQALAYKVGQLTILAERAKAQKALGEKFNLRAFHDEVLDSGALPLDVLDQRINSWIASQNAAR
ncbi:MAG TPA: DUF885 domain-containing protein [Terracidiphilus sp.]|nr:DUF885 domain-containing protein [Terracidiphilus sp.]